jgi:OTU domain-containing protein 6
MAGSKKNKLKKAVSAFTVQNASEADDEQLMDDLLAELDARNPTVRQEAATVIQEVELAHTPPKQDSKSRFQARQVRLYRLPHQSRSSSGMA